MSTGKEFANIEQTKLLGYTDLGDKFLYYLREYVENALKQVWDSDAVVGSALTMSGDAVDSFQITGDSYAVDGEGRLLRISESSVNTGVKFENANGIPYYVALQYAQIPKDVVVNPRTGVPQYAGWFEEIGASAAPDSVVDNGSNITLQVDSVTESGVSNAGRQVVVFKNIAGKDATTAAVAIETLTVTWNGLQNIITTTGILGQSTISTTASDYTVVLLGPIVKKNTDLRTVDGAVFVGIITGNSGTPSSFDATDQQLVDVTLSQLGQIFSKASNGRLKIDIRPATGEENINQIVVRDENGRIKWSVDEAGRTKFTAFPSVSSQNHPVPITKTTATTALTDARCITNCSFANQRKIILADATTAVLELWNADTMTLESSQDISAMLPADHVPISMFGDEQYVYVWARRPTPYNSVYLQAIDVTDWSVKPNWPATGVNLGSSEDGPGLQYIGSMVCDINHDTFAAARWRTDAQIALVSKIDGTILDVGDGDSIGTDFQPRALCSDGAYIYSLHIEDTPGATGYIVSASIDDLNVGLGAANWPYAIGSSSDAYPGLIATVDKYVAAFNQDGTVMYMVSKDNTGTLIFDMRDTWYEPALRDANSLISDGANLWMYGLCQRYQGGAQHPGLVRLNHHAAISNDSHAPGDDITFGTDEYREICDLFVLDGHSSASNNSGQLMAFDGSDIFVIATISQTLFKLPNALYKTGNHAKTMSRKSTTATIVSGVLDIDCNNSLVTVDVDQNITDVNFLNGAFTKTTVVFVAEGSYTISGFGTGSTRLWESSPRPPFSVTNGNKYKLDRDTINLQFALYQWTGPYSEL